MSQRRGASGARHLPPQRWIDAALTGLILIAGFLVVQTPIVQALFAAVAEILAFCASLILRIGGYGIVRNGVELRDLGTDYAIAVSPECDGSGLLIATVAGLVWFRAWEQSLQRLVASVAIAVVLIFTFNLVRVLVIFLSIGTPGLLETSHLFIAPLLSTLLIGAIVLFPFGQGRFQPLAALAVWAAIGAALAGVWFTIDEAASCAINIPLANALLTVTPDDVADSIGCAADGALLLTNAVLPGTTNSIIQVAFFPGDFVLATPLVLAALVVARRPARAGWGALAAGLLFALAAGIAAITSANDAAMAAGASQLAGTDFIQTYQPPSELLTALLKATQNALVHFNLLLLPLILLAAKDHEPVAKDAHKRRRNRS